MDRVRYPHARAGALRLAPTVGVLPPLAWSIAAAGPLRLRLLAAVGAALLIAATGCGQGDQPVSGNLAADQTLRFPIADDVGTLDPAQIYTSADIQLAQNLFDGLVRYDDDLNVVSDLASGLPAISADQLTYTFKLQAGARFSNGDRVTSHDVVYSWNRAAVSQGPYSSILSAVAGFDRLPAQGPAPSALERLLAADDPSVRISGLTAPDDATVVVRLAHPAGWFLSALALPGAAGMVVDQRVVQKDPQGWWTRPATLVGTGPYRLSGRSPGESLDFQAVRDWWGNPRPSVLRLHLDVVAGATDREAAYEQGQYDLNGFGGASLLSRADLDRIKSTPKLAAQLASRPGTGSAWVGFNLTHDAVRGAAGPFLDSLGRPARDLRMAFALAVDKQRLAAAVCAGMLCTPATGGLIPKGLKGYGGEGSDPLAAFDPTRARALLRGADPDGSRTRGLTFVYDAESSLYRALAENLRDQWSANLGVHVDIQPEAHQQLLRDWRVGKLVLGRAGWQADYDHPQDWYGSLFGRAAGCPDSSCASGFDSAQFDQVAAQAAATPLSSALPLYRQLGQMLSADAAYVPLVYSTRTYMIKPYVRGAGANNLLEHPWAEYEVLQHRAGTGVS
jgi:oligopeptide transport system substrate-binding protein